MFGYLGDRNSGLLRTEERKVFGSRISGCASSDKSVHRFDGGTPHHTMESWVSVSQVSKHRRVSRLIQLLFRFKMKQTASNLRWATLQHYSVKAGQYFYVHYLASWCRSFRTSDALVERPLLWIKINRIARPVPLYNSAISFWLPEPKSPMQLTQEHSSNLTNLQMLRGIARLWYLYLIQ